MLKLNEMMASFDNISLPAPKEITHDGDVQVRHLSFKTLTFDLQYLSFYVKYVELSVGKSF